MEFKINGFCASQEASSDTMPAYEPRQQSIVPRRSLAQVQFPGSARVLTYYNDQFDLKQGDRVYVDGTQEGILGRVVEINYNFKIRVSDYKKVIAVVDTQVSGQLHFAGSHFVTFDPAVLPAQKIRLWFCPPEKEDEEIVSSSDDTAFPLNDLARTNISSAIAERGHNYYLDNKVCYLCLNGSNGFAIVEGTQPYTVEFLYENGDIRQLICDCPCACTCKHELATMLQLRETLEFIEKHYRSAYHAAGYFAAMTKSTLFSFAIDGRETGSFTL